MLPHAENIQTNLVGQLDGFEEIVHPLGWTNHRPGCRIRG